jgi:hypothetical protein
MAGYIGQNALVTGANRGLGLSFIHYILKDYPEVKRLFAGCRAPEKAEVVFVGLKMTFIIFRSSKN